jgi:hypothetical protein
MAKPRLFISHVSEETALARLLKERLTRDFLDALDVFVSSDGKSIDAGEPWLKDVKTGLAKARFAIVLCSPDSIGKPWVNFECGAAWVRDIPLVPICHSGLTPENLPSPLNMLQGFQAADPEGLQSLYRTVARHLEMGVPAVDFNALAQAVQAVEGKYAEAARRRDCIVNPRILCASSTQYSQLEFDLDVQVLETYFPGRVVVERNLTSRRLRELLTNPRERFDILHLVLAVDPHNGDMYFSDTDLAGHLPTGDNVDLTSAAAFTTLVVETKASLVVLCTCQALYLGAKVAAVANMVATHSDITGSDAAKWADCFYSLLATGDHTLYKTDDLTAANFPRARMVLIRHKDVRFKAEAVAAV